MSRSVLVLRYGALLLELMRRAVVRRDFAGALSLADRWERAIASLPREPLLWEGDYA